MNIRDQAKRLREAVPTAKPKITLAEIEILIRAHIMGEYYAVKATKLYLKRNPVYNDYLRLLDRPEFDPLAALSFEERQEHARLTFEELQTYFRVGRSVPAPGGGVETVRAFKGKSCSDWYVDVVRQGQPETEARRHHTGPTLQDLITSRNLRTGRPCGTL